jgi:hypothetical protein
MNVRRWLSVVLCLLIVAVAACEQNQSAPTATPAPSPTPSPTPAPTAAPTPTPTPAPATFTVTGTITESAPTTGTKLGAATVVIGTRTITTDGAGAFTVTDLPAGTYTVQASKSGWDTATRTLRVPEDGSSFTLGLDPEYQQISRELTGNVGGDGRDCPGSHGNYTCWAYGFPAHHARGITADLYWHSSDARLELEMRCNEQTWVRTEGLSPDLLEFNREMYFHFRILENAKKNQACEIRVLHISGEAMPFIVTVVHPN